MFILTSILYSFAFLPGIRMWYDLADLEANPLLDGPIEEEVEGSDADPFSEESTFTL